MSLLKNSQAAFGANFENLFAKHYETFRYYLYYISIRDFIRAQKNALAQRTNLQFPVTDFLNDLSLHELRLLAVIKHIGMQTNDVYAGHLLSYANYQHYFRVLAKDFDYCGSREDYIGVILGTAQAPGDGYTFTLGLERLGIVLDDVWTSADYLAA